MKMASGKGSEATEEIVLVFYVSNEPRASVFSMNHKPKKQSAMYIKGRERSNLKLRFM